MHLFSKGQVWNIFAKFSLFSRNNDSMLESMIDKNLFEEPKTPMRQEKFYKRKQKKNYQSHVFFLAFPSVMFCSHVNKQKTS